MPPAAAKQPPTPEERHIKIEALKPAWLRDYIRSLEQINVALYQQVQELAGLPGTDHKHSVDSLGGATPEQLRDHIAKTHWGDQAPGQGLGSWGLEQLHAYHNGLHDGYSAGRRAAPVPPPDIKGDAVEGAVIRFGDFWTVRLAGPGLVVNTDEPMVLHPTSPDYLLIAKASHD